MKSVEARLSGPQLYCIIYISYTIVSQLYYIIIYYIDSKKLDRIGCHQTIPE